MLAGVIQTAEAVPDCPPTGSPGVGRFDRGRGLRAYRSAVGSIGRAIWDSMAARSPWTTPFSRWPFQRAWWEAYGSTAHDDTLLVEDPGGAPIGIVPLMHRHFSEPDDAATATELRHGTEPPLTALAPRAKVTFFGASYHADYATILCAPADLLDVGVAVAGVMAAPEPAGDHPEPWDAIDLRRLRCADPAVDALAAAFGDREVAEGWTLNVEREDVCPVVTVPEGADLDGFLATLDKKARHEIRRKVRRAEAVGEILLVDSADPLDDLPLFIDLHQRRWGDHGLFPDSDGGHRSRIFFRRLFEEHATVDGLRLSFLWIGGRRVGAAVWFDAGPTAYHYNAGLDPDARDLSPGVVMVERFVRRAIDEGTRRLDFLRGDEPYKYEWGAVDEPIVRLLVRRTGGPG
jgi:CelD/BcsL family acetyltransferase involved in cellulose biosynthesis